MNEIPIPNPGDKLILPLAVINEVLAYLGKRPFVEVAGLINAMQSNGQIVPGPPVIGESLEAKSIDDLPPVPELESEPKPKAKKLGTTS
jgi:hypothetical protein